MLIEIPAEVVERESETVTAQYRRVAKIPGFRPGHAPATLVRRHFRDDIRHEVVQSLVPRFFENAVKEKSLVVVGRPRFNDLKFEENQPLTCKATFEVLPEFELGEYKGIEVEEEEVVVTEEDVEKAMEEIRERAATFEVVQDHAAEHGDYVLVAYQGRNVKDPESHPVEAREALIHLGGKGTVAEFSQNLLGVRQGETREFDVTYSADHPQKSLADKTYHYRVEVQSIKKKVVPPLDDELAKSVSEWETLSEFREKIRAKLEEQKKQQAETTSKRKLLEELVNRHPFPVPGVLVEAQLDRRVESVMRQLIAQGIDPRQTELDWQKVREESRPEVEKEVRGSLILEKIAEREKIEVTDEEVDELIREMARDQRETAAALKTRLTEEGKLDRLKSSRRNHKSLEFIYRSARITRKKSASATES